MGITYLIWYLLHCLCQRRPLCLFNCNYNVRRRCTSTTFGTISTGEHKEDFCDIRVVVTKWTLRRGRTKVCTRTCWACQFLFTVFPFDSAKLRLGVKINDEYKDYKQLPTALVAQQGPVGPARPKQDRKAITAGRSCSYPYRLKKLAHTLFSFDRNKPNNCKSW